MATCKSGRTAESAIRASMKHLAKLAAALGAGNAAEKIHDMRIVTRRLRAALRLLGDAAGPDVARFRENLARLSAALGQVRDADVFLAFLDDHARRKSGHDTHALRRLARSERRRRRLFCRRLTEHLESEDCRAWLASPSALAESPSALSRSPERPDSPAVSTIQECLARVTRYRKRLTRYAVAKQHRLRIACKRLRYTAEFFAGRRPETLDSLIPAMVRMQGALGAAHDAELHLARIREHLGRLAPAHRDNDARTTCRRLCAVLREQRKKALRKAESRWRKFLSRKVQRRVAAQLERLAAD